jgi:hypothetical protein
MIFTLFQIILVYIYLLFSTFLKNHQYENKINKNFININKINKFYRLNLSIYNFRYNNISFYNFTKKK